MAHDRLTRPYNYIHSNEAPNFMRAMAPWKSGWQALTSGKKNAASMAGTHALKGMHRAFDYFSGKTSGSFAPAKAISQNVIVNGRIKPGSNVFRSIKTVGGKAMPRPIYNTGMQRLKVGGARTLAAYVGLRVAGGLIGGISDALSGD